MPAFDLRSAANAAGYRVQYNESAEIRGEDESLAWFPQIPGRDKRNFISVWSDRRLAAYTFTRRLHDRLKAIPGTEVVLWAFDGTQSGNANRLVGYLDGVAQFLTFSGTIPAAISTDDTGLRTIKPRPKLIRFFPDGTVDFVILWLSRVITAS